MDPKLLKPLLTILTILFSGNMFFVSRLVTKIDDTANAVWELKVQVGSMQSSIEALTEKRQSSKGQKKTTLAIK